MTGLIEWGGKVSKFENKVVVITGAGNGIGRRLALRYAEAGARVAIVDKDKGGLAETGALIVSKGYPEVYASQLDLSDLEAIAPVIADIERAYGRIDILVNNAGLGIWKSPYELDFAEWDYVLRVNLGATFFCSREAAKAMKRAGGGAIVNIASTRAFSSEPNSEAYAASKGGIVALTHALAASLGPDGIRVNAVSPGWIETGDYDKLHPIDHSQHPAGRVGHPDDVAKAVMYLSDPHNGFVTGINLTVDGGMSHKMIYAE